MKKILVPVDFSDTSKNALLYALDLFEGSQMEITILHIFGTHSTALMMKSIDGILIKNAERDLNALIDEIRAKAPSVIFKTKLAKNYAVSTISKLGDSGIYDLIIMGTKGVSGMKEVFMGSVAGGVISNTSAPVIVVPLDYKFTPLEKVVFAIGDINISDKSKVEPIREIVKTHGSKLEVLHISEKGEPDVIDSLKAFEDLNPKFSHKTGSGDLNQHLNVHINNNDVDLLCLMRTKKDFFDRILSSSVTLKQTFNSTVPLLIVHK
ncbi:universal stress protein [Winogradskyella sp. DF17]|uniref:Universal stress protein n=1 Tax=Winogradskyella pelagia TaxID=2819984 RepID=A0ABS3SZZ8_9FLAO|nr:universal stress protein [Winogradskyella sp. DF17]MBO3116071.1 universal stress protein [Winogradskyella sp. DF17]